MEATDMSKTITLPMKLKRIRKLRKITQLVLAVKTGVSISEISHYETGRRTPSVKILRILCVILNVSSDYLLDLYEHERTLDRVPKTMAVRKNWPPTRKSVGA